MKSTCLVATTVSVEILTDHRDADDSAVSVTSHAGYCVTHHTLIDGQWTSNSDSQGHNCTYYVVYIEMAHVDFLSQMKHVKLQGQLSWHTD